LRLYAVGCSAGRRDIRATKQRNFTLTITSVTKGMRMPQHRNVGQDIIEIAIKSYGNVATCKYLGTTIKIALTKHIRAD